VRTVCYVEIDSYCQKLIQARITDGYLDDAPIWDDARTFDGKPWRGCVDIFTAGFPCQPHSVAGQRCGESDERNLWPDTLRVIRDVGPAYVLLENVPGILADPGYAGTVVGQLAEIGYDCLWDCVSAVAVGAPHERERWWVFAVHTDTKRCHGWQVFDRKNERAVIRDGYWNAAPSIKGWSKWKYWLSETVPDGHWCRHEAVFCGVDDGTPEWVAGIETGGNGIVPAVVAEFLRGH